MWKLPADQAAKGDAVTGIVSPSDNARTGGSLFRTSGLISFSEIQWGQRANYSVFNRLPAARERLGWMGDGRCHPTRDLQRGGRVLSPNGWWMLTTASRRRGSLAT